MGEAYTPGLEVREATMVRKSRILPIPGETLVKKGDKVEPQTKVARANLLGTFTTVDVRSDLGILLGEVKKAIKEWFKVKLGDVVKEGDVLASRKYFFGRRVKESIAPVSGTIGYISDVTGKLHIRAPPVPVEVTAYIPGEVVEVIPGEGVIVETFGAYVQGIFGIGGETHGVLEVVVSSPDEILTVDKINSSHTGKILVGGSLITGDALQKAAKNHVNGIIVGSIEDDSLVDYLGYEIGVAVTGEEKVNTTLIMTEGFGKMSMLTWTFNLLKKFEGKQVSISGATHIRAGVIRPEIIIPREVVDIVPSETEETSSRLESGTVVRIIRGEEFGSFAKVFKLEPISKQIETESKTSVIVVTLENGKQLTLPRANVEIIGRGVSK
ncbi:hypothetical protein DRO61_07850 [Candidatus Bathyarchaeota archaeon]|nr:MAG: hypothetical protein DRO61_07850 [Candidatus Bathyarchaeota archaeon]